jgi:hypothetical protein
MWFMENTGTFQQERLNHNGVLQLFVLHAKDTYVCVTEGKADLKAHVVQRITTSMVAYASALD